MKRISIILLSAVIAVATLAGCANGQALAGAKYSIGKGNIQQMPDEALIKESRFHRMFQKSVLYNNRFRQPELDLIYAELKRRHPDWNWDAIGKGLILRGMTKDEVAMVNGYPLRYNRYADMDQWVYHYGSVARHYVYFRNGKVVETGYTGRT